MNFRIAEKWNRHTTGEVTGGGGEHQEGKPTDQRETRLAPNEKLKRRPGQLGTEVQLIQRPAQYEREVLIVAKRNFLGSGLYDSWLSHRLAPRSSLRSDLIRCL